jgi:hypothetical protein
MKNTVTMTSIYDQILQHYGWENYRESKLRLLRIKYSFLQKNLVLCDPDDFKEKGANVVPENDAPIIRDLLIEAVNDSEDNMVVDWFNGKVDTSDSSMAYLLFMHLKHIIMKPCMMGETDEVTMDEWLNTVSAAINYSTAENTLKIKRALENFRNNSLPLDSTVGYGDIIATHEDGSRTYSMQANRTPISIRGKTVEQILDEVATQNDYFEVLAQLLNLFDEHAKAKARENIETLAMKKEAFDLEHLDVGERDSIASEYTIWYQRLHDFLTKNPDICTDIEKKFKTENLAEFFRMKGR